MKEKNVSKFSKKIFLQEDNKCIFNHLAAQALTDSHCDTPRDKWPTRTFESSQHKRVLPQGVATLSPRELLKPGDKSE